MTFDPDQAFIVANAVALWGWIALLFSPWNAVWADRIGGYIIPALLSLAYVPLVLTFFGTTDGGYFTLDDVIALFSRKEVVLAGWLHVLAFDLFIAGWMVRTARSERIRFVTVLACLPFTFLFGPVGLLLFLLLRTAGIGRHSDA